MKTACWVICCLWAWQSWGEVVHDAVTVSAVLSQGLESYLSIPFSSSMWNADRSRGVTRINSATFTCQFFSANSPWKIKIYHTNQLSYALTLQSNGIATSGVPLKVWQPNYGPTNYYATGHMPNPMSAVWKNNSRYVVGREDNVYLASQDQGDASPLVFNFMADIQNAVFGALYTGDIYFELSIP